MKCLTLAVHMSGMRFVNGNTPTILWDMDGTMYHWSSRLNEILLELDPAFPIVPEGQRVGFDYFWVPGADRDTILAAMNDPADSTSGIQASCRLSALAASDESPESSSSPHAARNAVSGPIAAAAAAARPP